MFFGRSFYFSMPLYDIALRDLVNVYFVLLSVCDRVLRKFSLFTFWLCIIKFDKNLYDIPFMILKICVVIVRVSISCILSMDNCLKVGLYVHNNCLIQILYELFFFM